MKNIKRKYLIYLLTAVMVLSPAAVFADTGAQGQQADPEVAVEQPDVTVDAVADNTADVPDEEVAETEDATEEAVQVPVGGAAVSSEAKHEGEVTTGPWNADKTQYTDPETHEIITNRLFKGKKDNDHDVYALFYADPNGYVEKKEGIIEVPTGPFYSYNTKEAAFDVDSSLKGPVKYYVKHDTDYNCYCIDSASRLVKNPKDGKQYYLQPNGTIQTTAGIITVNSVKYFVQNGGAIQTTVGWANVGNTRYYVEDNTGRIRTAAGTFPFAGKTWFTDANGVVRTTAGLVPYGSTQYYAQGDGSILTTAGFITVNGKKYLVQNGGAISKTAGKISYGGKYYVANADGSINTRAGFASASGKVYYVTGASGVLAVNKSMKIKKKTYHIMPDATVATGVHKWAKKLYYSDSTGALSTKKMVVKTNGKYYHVNKGGKVTINKKVKYKKKSYIASKNGVIYTGLFKWKGNLYFANNKAVLRTSKGLFTYDGKKYCTRKGGKIYRNTTFKVGGNKYSSDSNGVIKIGFYKSNGKYYLTNSKGVVITKEGIYQYNKKYYYISSGGVIPASKFVTFRDKHYYAGSDGALMTKKFKYKGITIRPSSKGEISLEDYYKVFPDEAPKEVDDESNGN